MLKAPKIATPATAFTVAVPDSVPPTGLVAIATVTAPVNPVAVLPKASRAVTWSAGLKAVPATAVAGWTLKTRCVAVAAVTVNPGEVTDGRPAAPACRA